MKNLITILNSFLVVFTLVLNATHTYGASRQRPSDLALVNERLMQAIRDGDVDGVHLALNTSDVDVNYSDSNGYTPLILASSSGNLEITAKLLNVRGIQINKMNSSKSLTPLGSAIANHHYPVFLCLLNQGADIGKKQRRYPHVEADALGFAAYYGQLEMVRELIRRGADINRSGIDILKSIKATPIEFASFNGHVEVVKELLVNGAKIPSSFQSVTLQLAYKAITEDEKNMHKAAAVQEHFPIPELTHIVIGYLEN